MRSFAGLFFALSLAVMFCAMPLCAMDWPAADGVVIRNFGYNDKGRPVLGTVFRTDGEVLASEEGELIFSRTGADRASRLPSPLGAWAALDHGDGLISIYSRYNDPSVSPSRESFRPARGSSLASAGTSGWSSEKGFYFVLYDRRERRWVNPSMIIAAPEDSQPPRISSVELRNEQGGLVSGGQLRNLNQGRYRILVSAADLVQNNGQNFLSPHRIICSVNGAETGSLHFETISARDGVLMVYRNGLVPAKQVYGPYPAFEAGEVFLNRGQASLEVIVQDAAGNSRSASMRIMVN
jgi:hypothetical protein